MKRILYITTLFLTLSTAVFAQDDEGGKVRERMIEYMQKSLNLSRAEAERFTPVFLNYFNEVRQTNQQYRGDRLVLQQKLADLRVRYRDQFKPIMGEKRSNEVFKVERDFYDALKDLRQERMQHRGGRPGKGLGGLLP